MQLVTVTFDHAERIVHHLPPVMYHCEECAEVAVYASCAAAVSV